MSVSQRLDIRQSQSLVMTPQLQQAIKLLQMSHLELAEFVADEMERNPLLERAEGEYGGDAEGAAEQEPPPAQTEAAEPPDALSLTQSDRIGNPEEPGLDTDFDNLWSREQPGQSGDDTPLTDWNRGGAGTDEELPDLGQTLSRPETLREHVTGQIMMEFADPAERLIALSLFELLDEAGWLTGDWQALADQFGTTPERIEAVIAKTQTLDPVGLFARNLKECLAIQLAERDRLDPAMQTLLDHLDRLAIKDMAGLMRICGVDAEDLAQMIAEIRALSPKPAIAFDHEVAQTQVPDVLLRPSPEGGWIVELNPDTLPRVLINHRYVARVESGRLDKADKAFLSEKLAAANWLVRTLDQRSETILKVASEIVRRQDAFFIHGVEALKPMVLRDVAEAIEMHESTISRVTSNKTMQTPRGLFELKYFFSAALAGAGGEASHSAEAVRHRIKRMIDDEQPNAILSDDTIMERLEKDGIVVARRTVAKYREAMGIGSSVQRRREKMLSLGRV